MLVVQALAIETIFVGCATFHVEDVKAAFSVSQLGCGFEACFSFKRLYIESFLVCLFLCLWGGGVMSCTEVKGEWREGGGGVKAPRITQRTMFWTLSSLPALFFFIFAAVPYVVDAYSLVGLGGCSPCGKCGPHGWALQLFLT